MPFVIDKNPDLSLITVFFWGQLDDKTLFEYMAELETGDFSSERMDLLLLIDDKSSISVGTDMVRLSAKQEQAFHSKAKRVIVTSRDLAYGLSRVYFTESETTGTNQFLFDSVEKAANALGLDSEQLSQQVNDLVRRHI